MLKYKTITLNSWAQISDLEVEFATDIYRGHWDAKWDLTSALLRRCRNVRHDDEALIDAERGMISEFQRRLHHYDNNVPDESDLIAWLAIMQHHSACTRLIDFTHSFYIALFFAITLPEREACIWAIDEVWLRDASREFANSMGLSINKEFDYLMHWDEAHTTANAFLKHQHSLASKERLNGRTAPKGAFLVEPKKQIKRLALQQGLFVLPTDPRVCLLKNLEALVALPKLSKRYQQGADGTFPIIRKIIIPASLNECIRMHLKAMNITAESLFPGIEGFAKSVVEQEVYPITCLPEK